MFTDLLRIHIALFGIFAVTLFHSAPAKAAPIAMFPSSLEIPSHSGHSLCRSPQGIQTTIFCSSTWRSQMEQLD